MEVSSDLNMCTHRILELKQEFGKNVYDIGVYLNHVKDNKLYLTKYKFWLEYLEKEVKISERSAQRFMKMVKEDPTLLSELGPSKCEILLTIPQEERKEIIEEVREMDMSTEQIRKLAKGRMQDTTKIGEKGYVDGVPEMDRRYFLDLEDNIGRAFKMVEQIKFSIDGLEFRKTWNQYARKGLVVKKLEKLKKKIRNRKYLLIN